MSSVMDIVKQRVIEITTPLGDDVLLFSRMNAHEALAKLPSYEIDLLSKRSDIDLDEIMGKNVTVKLQLPLGQTRYFNGYVTRFSQMAMQGSYYAYHATVSPWFWFLTRRLNCRIFQNMSVPQIIEKIFEDHTVVDFKSELSGTYGPWEYCVQYRESDFSFLSRLMEMEGIYYYFRHEEKRHTLVLADSYTAHSPVAGYEQIPFIPTGSSTRPKREHITDWRVEREIQTGKFVMDDYNFKTPSVELQAQTQITQEHELGDLEIYDYPGEYDAHGDGQHYVRTRLESLHAQFEIIHGAGNARGIAVGSLFDLTGHTRVDQNDEYLITSANHTLEYSTYEAGQGGGADYRCSFTAMNSSRPFRPLRTTPKGNVLGPQTAVVVGPAGDEIYTDKYGRVKVQFHWDREGKHDENASCWLRVSHPWAGKGWGAISIPRIGQEVIVDFLEGDPDQPIITGRVYNAEQMPPWALPANATQSGMLSRSSKGAAAPNANAIRMEDKMGEEQLWFHAEKDQLTEVEHDEDKWVGNDRRKTIDGHETTVVHKNRTETVDLNETITVHKNRQERVDLNETISIGINRSENVGANETIAIGANRSVTIGANKTETVAIAKAETIGAAKALTIGAGYAVTVGGAMNTAVGLASFEEVGLTKQVIVGKTLRIQAGDSIELVCGKSVLILKKDGTINLNGKDIDITGDKHVQLGSERIDIN